MTSEIRLSIIDALSQFTYYQGYSNVPKSTQQLSLIYSVVNSFYNQKRIYDLNIQQVFNLIKNNYVTTDYKKGFYGIEAYSQEYRSYRMKPIEFFSQGTHKNTDYINFVISPKNTYLALQSLNLISKIDEFASEFSLSELLNSLVNCQYLQENSAYFGGFIPAEFYYLFDPELINYTIFFENAYYAVKSMELIVNYTNLDSLTDLNFSKSALFQYIENNLVETSQTLYFQPEFCHSPEKKLEYTYYAIEILKLLNLYGLDTIKVKNFLEAEIDYSNIKNVYYSYKIVKLLGLDFEFNHDEIYHLVEDLYIQDIQEFKESTSQSTQINQDMFYYITELACKSPIHIQIDLSSAIFLGHVVTLNLTFYNLILRRFGSSIDVTLEVPFSGIHYFESRSNNIYFLNLLVPYDSNNFPSFDGMLNLISNGELLKTFNLVFNTFIKEDYSYIIDDSDEVIFIKVNYSRRTSYGYANLNDCFVYVDINGNSTLIRTTYLNYEIFPTCNI
jgi:hypothetical protein